MTGEPGPVDAGWMRALRRGPRTVADVLRGEAAAMDERDRQANDPLVWARVPSRPRRRLLDRLLGR